MAIEVTLRRWGNSKGAIFPKDFIEKHNLKENEKISIEVVKPADLSGVFGSMKDIKMPGQKFKDMVRKGWHD